MANRTHLKKSVYKIGTMIIVLLIPFTIIGQFYQDSVGKIVYINRNQFGQFFTDSLKKIVNFYANYRPSESIRQFSEINPNKAKKYTHTELYTEMKNDISNHGAHFKYESYTYNEAMSNSWFKEAWNRIVKISDTEKGNRSLKELKDITNLINLRKKTEKGAWLHLKLGELYVENDSWFLLSFDSLFDATLSYINQIENYFDKGKAIEYLADLEIKYNYCEKGVQLYYLASELINKSNKNPDIKNYEEGLIRERLGQLFEKLNALNSIVKGVEFYHSASIYFKVSNNIPKSVELLLREQLCESKLCQNTVIFSHQVKRMEILKKVSDWYTKYINNETSGKDWYKANYLGTAIIGSILTVEGKVNAAVMYLVESVIFAWHTYDPSIINDAVRRLIDFNRVIGDKKVEFDYCDLLILLAEQTQRKEFILESYIIKASSYSITKQYDSVIKYVDYVLSEKSVEIRTLLNKNLLWLAYQLKVSALTNLNKNTESLKGFTNATEAAKKYWEASVVASMKAEGESLNKWLESVKNYEIQANKSVYNIQKEKDSVIHIKDILFQAGLKDKITAANNIIQLKEDLNKSISDKAYSDSIQSDSIIRLNRIIAQDAIEKQKSDSLENKRRIKEKQDENDKLYRNGITIILFVTMSGIVLFLYMRSKRSKAENKRVAAESDKIWNENQVLLHRGKNHEYVHLSAVTAESTKALKGDFKLFGQFDKQEFFENLNRLTITSELINEYAKKHHKDTQEELNSINSELEMSKLYLSIFKIDQELTDEILLINTITDNYILNDLKVPTHFLHNFIMNSIDHARDPFTNFNNVNIFINGRQLENSYIIEIDDDGQGINHPKSNHNKIDKGTGIPWAKSYVNSYNNRNLGFNILFSDNSIIDKSEVGKGTGTLVTIIFNKPQ